MKTGLYPGTFDPVTNGHLDILSRSLAVFDRIVVGVAEATPKATFFSMKDRVEMIEVSTADLDKVEVRSFSGLLVAFAREVGAAAVIRGLRVISDFEYEFQLALMNRRLDKDLETVFLMPSEEYTYLNSSLIKQIASTGADVSCFVPKVVEEKLRQRFGKP